MEFGFSGLRVGLIAAALICALGFAASASAATLAGTVSGQAPGEEAKPLPETLVTVTAAGSEEAMGTTTADANGAYSLEVPDGVFDVRFEPPSGYEPTTVHEVEVKGSRTLSVVLTSANLVHLTGILRNAEGEPVSNAIPALIAGDKGFYGERTDENGHFEIVALPGTYRLSVGGEEASAPNTPDNWSFEIPSLTIGSDRDLGELRLPPTTRLTVEVLDAEGAPLPKSTVSIPPLFRQADLGGAFATELMSGGDGNGHLSGRTDGDGRVSFLVFGGTVAPWAKPEVVPPLTSGYGRAAFSVPPVEGDTTVVVHPDRTAHLTGILRNAEGEPVSNAIPALIAGDKGFYGERTDENGHFEIVALPGTYRLSVGGEEASAPNTPDNWSFEIPSLTIGSDRDLGELRLPPTTRLTVEVLDAEGAPLPKSTVSIPPLFRQADLGGAFATELMSGGDGNGHLSGRTDGDGRVSFLVFGGTVAPWAKPEVVPPLTSGYGRAAFSVPPVEGDTTVVVHPDRTAHLTGILRNAEGEPVSNAIPALIAGDKGFYGERTDENGHFEIVALPGTYRLSVGGEEASAPNTPDNWSFEIPSLTIGSDRDLGELRLPPTTRLTVEVLDAEGAPLPKSTVSIPPLFRQADLGGAFATELMSGGDGNGHLSGRTDGDGRVSFLVFGGTVAPWAKPEVVPPLTSGYGRAAFSVPPVEGDTTVVVRFTKAGEEEPEADMAGPQLKELGIEPASIDASTSAQEVLVRAHIADDLSGFAGGTLAFTSPSGEETVESSAFERWNGSATAGDYEILVLFPQSSEAGDWALTRIRLVDAAGNETVLGLEQLEAMEFQHLVHVRSPPPPPAVTAVEPSFGTEVGSTEVLIAGSGFAAGAEVFFGSTLALEAVVNSDESITAKAPAGSGTVDVTVKTGAGVSEAGPATIYRYSPPVTLKSNPNPAQQGNKVTFTARVTPLAAGAPVPTGAVVFTEGSTTLAVASLSEGKATFSTSTLAVGAHAVTARYAGDAYFGPGNSAPVSEDVVPKKGGGH